MPSSLIVPVANIEKLEKHNNADNLEIAHVLGWQTIVAKGQHKAGDKVVYIPIDCMLPVELSDKWGVTSYLHKQRVKCARLRGVPSFGFIIALDDDSVEVGSNLAEYYGIEKWEPPVRMCRGGSNSVEKDALPDLASFPRYTHIENMRNFPDIFTEGEPVVVTEKIHGTNCRVGFVDGEYVAGSHRLRRKAPEDQGIDSYADNTYWFPLSLPNVKEMINYLSQRYKQVILYGEVYGNSIQTLDYGVKDRLAFRVGRVVLKYINDEYLFAKKSDFQDI